MVGNDQNMFVSGVARVELGWEKSWEICRGCWSYSTSGQGLGFRDLCICQNATNLYLRVVHFLSVNFV